MPAPLRPLLIKAGFAAHNRDDLDALTQVYDPDVVFETLLLGTHHGNRAIRLIYEENQKTLSGYTVDPIELIDAGNQVVAVAQVNGVGPASQIAMEDRDPFAFSSRSRTGGWCENRPSETGRRPSKPPGCRSRRPLSAQQPGVFAIRPQPPATAKSDLREM